MSRLVPPVILITAVMSLAACGDTAASETTMASTTTVATTVATTTSTTTMPTVAAAPELIRIAPGSIAGNFRLEVLEGKYQVASGTELWAGSSLLNIPEELLLFPEGLRIDIAEDVTLGGETFSAGSELIVNAVGELVDR